MDFLKAKASTKSGLKASLELLHKEAMISSSASQAMQPNPVVLDGVWIDACLFILKVRLVGGLHFFEAAATRSSIGPPFGFILKCRSSISDLDASWKTSSCLSEICIKVGGLVNFFSNMKRFFEAISSKK